MPRSVFSFRRRRRRRGAPLHCSPPSLIINQDRERGEHKEGSDSRRLAATRSDVHGGGAMAAARAGGRGVGVPVRVVALDRGDGRAGRRVAREAGALLLLDGVEGLVGGRGHGGHVGAAPVPDGAVPGVPVLLVGGDGGLFGLEGGVVEGGVGAHCCGYCCCCCWPKRVNVESGGGSGSDCFA
ncbi:hypothetical protein BC567DRAFT_237132 [Phyllosticta citribraziliensis]